MRNILLTGIGGQGTVLAAKILAQAAMCKGWEVRTAETIGMAQRGGSVVSHVRIGDLGETVYEPLLPFRSADLVIAFEPGEAARVLPYLDPEGLLVSATSAIQPVSAALSNNGYQPDRILSYLGETLRHFVAVDDAALCEKAGGRKVLNTILLAKAIQASESIREERSSIGFGSDIGPGISQSISVGIEPVIGPGIEPIIGPVIGPGIGLGIGIDDLKQAVRECVKEQFVAMNLSAIDIAVGRGGSLPEDL